MIRSRLGGVKKEGAHSSGARGSLSTAEEERCHLYCTSTVHWQEVLHLRVHLEAASVPWKDVMQCLVPPKTTTGLWKNGLTLFGNTKGSVEAAKECALLLGSATRGRHGASD